MPCQLPLSDAERILLRKRRALRTDEEGGECLVGLTREESEEYLALADRNCLSGADADRFIGLGDRHDAVRLQIIAAENELRQGGVKH